MHAQLLPEIDNWPCIVMKENYVSLTDLQLTPKGSSQ